MARYRKVSETEWVQTGKGSVGSAEDIMYDNTESRMEATNVQDAIDEQRQDLTQLETDLNNAVKLDWSNKESVYDLSSVNGIYTAKDDGVMFISFTSSASGYWQTLLHHSGGVDFGELRNAPTQGFSINYSIPMNAGDSLTNVVMANATLTSANFVPYKR